MQHVRSAVSLFWRGAFAALVALGGANSPVRAQEVYKSVDAQGHVVYSDRGTSKTAPTTTVHVKQPDPAEVARLAKEQQILDAAEIERRKQEAIDNKNKAAADHNKQAACENARNKYYRLKDSGRLYQRDADGNRSFYSDAEADALREQARRAMVGACGT